MKYDRQQIKRFLNEFQAKYIDICVVTCHRLPYLMKCIWSIIASTTVPYRIFVIDDQSDDGTIEFLKNLKERGLIHHLVLNTTKLGTARSLNEIIDVTDSSWFVFTNDDMWFHRYWDYHAMNIVAKMERCGIVSMFNYTATVNKKITHDINWAPATGLGATFMYRKLWDKSEKFYMPTTKTMHFFSTTFCKKLNRIPVERNQIYVPNPPDVIHMDLIRCKLNERDYSDKVGYTDYRKSQKMMKSQRPTVVGDLIIKKVCPIKKEKKLKQLIEQAPKVRVFDSKNILTKSD